MTLELLAGYAPALARGALLTIELTAAATAIAVVIGLIAAVVRLWGPRPLAVGVTAYIEVVRGTPAIVQLFIVYYGLGQVGLALPAFVAAVLALGSFGGAYFAEIFRAGFAGVDRGQLEAAASLGLNPVVIFRRILFPQSLVLVLPPASNMLIDLLKATALVVTIGAPDLMYAAFNGASTTFRAMEFYAVAGAMYLFLAVAVADVFRRLEIVANRHGS